MAIGGIAANLVPILNLPFHCIPLHFTIYWVVELHCIAFALQLCCLYDASVRCLSFHINSTEHSIITQAASQWVSCFSGSLPIVLIHLWLIIFSVSFSENKYDDDDQGPGSLSNTMLIGITWVSVSNGISFRPTGLAGCTSVTYIHTDGQTTLRYHLSQ